MERIGSQIMIAFRMPLEEPLNCRAQRHWFHRFVQDNVACHAGPVPRLQCRIAADEEGWNFCVKFASQALDYLDACGFVLEVVIRDDQVGRMRPRLCEGSWQ